MEVYNYGTEIETKLGGVKAIITALSIRQSLVSYECSYFLDGDYKAIWLSESEFNVSKENKLKIGFK